MIVTISGPPGSGKSTVTRLLAPRLKAEIVCAGRIFREQAESCRKDLREFGAEAEISCEIDKKLDARIVNIARGCQAAKKSAVIEGRLVAWMCMRNNVDALKVYIDAPLKTRAERIAGREKITTEKARKDILERENCEKRRYEKHYNISLEDKSVYDLVIDSGNKNPDEIVDIILSEVRRRE